MSYFTFMIDSYIIIAQNLCNSHLFLCFISQEAQLSQRDHVMLYVIEYFDKSFKVIRNYTLE